MDPKLFKDTLQEMAQLLVLVERYPNATQPVLGWRAGDALLPGNVSNAANNMSLIATAVDKRQRGLRPHRMEVTALMSFDDHFRNACRICSDVGLIDSRFAEMPEVQAAIAKVATPSRQAAMMDILQMPREALSGLIGAPEPDARNLEETIRLTVNTGPRQPGESSPGAPGRGERR